MEIGSKIHRIKSCSSTNVVARELAEKGAEEGEVVVCGEQTKGKGTQGRRWFSMPDKGLYFSVVLFPLRSDLSVLPLAVSLGVREAIFSHWGVPTKLKWPNDLVCEGLKIGGVLCESSFSGKKLNYSVAGIGINVKQNKDDFPGELKKSAASLEMFSQKDIDREILLSAICCCLENWYKTFLKRKDEEILREYLKVSSYQKGDLLKAEAKERSLSGRFKGLDREGKIVLEIEGNEERFLSGEITIKEKLGGLK